MKPALVSVGLLVLLAGVCSAEQVLTTADQANIQSLVLNKAGSDGQFGGSMANAFHAVEALAALGALEKAKAGALCKLAAKELASPDPAVQPLFHASRVLTLLKCWDASSAGNADRKAQAALRATTVLGAEGGVDPPAFALATLATLKDAGQNTPAPPAAAVQAAVKALHAQMHAGGRFKAHPSAEGTSGLATGRALLALAAARRLLPDLGDATSAADAILAAVPGMLASSDSTRGAATSADVDRLEATAAVLAGVAALAPAGLDVLQLGQLGAFLTGLKEVGTLSDAAHVATGIAALTSGRLPIPLVAHLKQPYASPGHKEVEGRMTDLADQPAQGRVKVQLAMFGDKEEVVVYGPGSAPGDFTLSYPGDFELGPHRVELELYNSEGVVAGRAQLDVVFRDSAVVRGVRLVVEEGDGGTVAQEQRVDPPRSLAQPLPLDPNQQLKVSFSVVTKTKNDPLAPQQAMLRLTSEATGAATYVAAKPLRGVFGGMQATVTASVLSKRLGAQGGAVRLELLVGDAGLAEPLTWRMGSLALAPVAADDIVPSGALDAFQPKPEIRHLHRQPERRPPASVSLLFTALATAPLLLVLVLWARLGVNLKGYPTGGANLIASTAFHGGIAAILGLFLLFWLRLNLLQTLALLAPLAVFTAIVGHYALSWHAVVRAKSE